MAPRIPNRFTTGTPVTPACTDMNFEALRLWGGDVDDAVLAANASIGGVASDLSDLGDVVTAHSSTLAGHITDISTLQGLTTDINDEIDDLRDNVVTPLLLPTIRYGSYYGTHGIPYNTNTRVNLSSEVYDPFGWHSGTSAYVTPSAGVYVVMCSFNFSGGGLAATDRVNMQLHLNDSYYVDVDRYAGSSSPGGTIVSPPIDMNGSTDDFSVVVYHNNASTLNCVVRLGLWCIAP